MVAELDPGLNLLGFRLAFTVHKSKYRKPDSSAVFSKLRDEKYHDRVCDAVHSTFVFYAFILLDRNGIR
jgi:hypothetical protein